jgi:hypothetical protein
MFLVSEALIMFLFFIQSTNFAFLAPVNCPNCISLIPVRDLSHINLFKGLIHISRKGTALMSIISMPPRFRVSHLPLLFIKPINLKCGPQPAPPGCLSAGV